MNIHSIYRPFLLHFRRRRIEAFYRMFGVTSESKVLDVGGSWFNWRLAASSGLPLPRLTILNKYSSQPLTGGVNWVVGDGRSLPFEDGSFDVVFCNSVIEHLSYWESQAQFAAEIRRVGSAYFVQTPNRRFPIEPHLVTPFFHWVPMAWRRRLLRNFTVWGLVARPSAQECEDFLNEVRLLNWSEISVLFPEAAVIAERWLGLVKSIVAVSAPVYPRTLPPAAGRSRRGFSSVSPNVE